MPFYFFHWTSKNIEHLAENDVIPDEFETVLMDPFTQTVANRGSARPTMVQLTAEERLAYSRAVGKKMASKAANIAAAKPVARRLKAEREQIIALVARLAAARAKAGISLSEMEQRTGIQKSSLSRLENSAAPNPTLLTLYRYAAAIGYQLDFQIEPEN